MGAQILDGKATAAQIKQEIKARVAALAKRGVTPGLGVILVGADSASQKYASLKQRDCAEVGMRSLRQDLPADATPADVRAAIHRFNDDPACTGYLIQLPLPDGLPQRELLEEMDPEKDADGLHPVNLGRLVLGVYGGLTSPVPCTPAGAVELLTRNGVSLAGKRVTIVGRGLTSGRPLALLLTTTGINATVTTCHRGTRDLHGELRRADVVVGAVGIPHVIKPEDVAPGAVLVDIGVTREQDPETGKWRTLGDIDPAAWEHASWATPNPGGVGPMTRVMLLENVVRMAERRVGLRE